MNNLNEVESRSVFRNADCPFQHLSTKHMSMRRLPVDINAAAKSNSGRTALLMQFSKFVRESDLPLIQDVFVDFDELAKRSNIQNPHSPASLVDVFPVPETRSLEETWAKLGRTGSPLVGHLAMRHAELYNLSHSHSIAAHEVMREIADEQNSEIMALLHSGVGGLRKAVAVAGAQGIPISAADSEALLKYQLIQERWMTRTEIRNLNDMIYRRPELMRRILYWQQLMCKQLASFFAHNPRAQSGSLAFAEIGMLENEGLNVVPSSRLLKVLLHNLGPWLTEFANMDVDRQILMAVTKARREMAFEQYISIIEGQGAQQRYLGTIRKTCPARNALVRIIEAVVSKEETPNG